MTLIVTDPREQRRLIADRRERGIDRFDEMWEGTYVTSPIADNEHQYLQTRLAAVLLQVVTDPQARVLAGTNVSDRQDQWEHNYRVPDIAVFLPNTTARNCGSHWFGGPDFAVEILSPGDRTPQKVPFYASVNVRELLVIGRDSWSLELYRLRDGELLSVGTASISAVEPLLSEVIPLSFRLITGPQRPMIEVGHLETAQTWMV